MGERLDLGVGMVTVAGLDTMWPELGGLIDYLEVEPQTIWDEHGGSWIPNADAFAWLRAAERPIVAHGVGFPVGGTVAPDPAAVALFAACATELDATFTSEHLSFNAADDAGGRHWAGFLLPPRQTSDAVDIAVEHVASYQRAVQRPFLVETGVNYLAPVAAELSDGRFVAEIATRSDCGILLDLHNLWANERNGRQPLVDVLAELPLERVLEVHVAGGFELNGYWLDAHSGRSDDRLIAILAAVLPRLPNVRAVTFEALPEHAQRIGPRSLRAELERLHQVVDAARRSPVRGRRDLRRRGTTRAVPSPALELAEWERQVIAYTTRASATPPGADPGFDLLRLLTDNARLGRVAAAAGPALVSLGRRVGLDALDEVVQRYLTECPAAVWASAEGRSFERWLAA